MELSTRSHLLIVCKDLVGEPHHVDWSVILKVIDVWRRHWLDRFSFQERHRDCFES